MEHTATESVCRDYPIIGDLKSNTAHKENTRDEGTEEGELVDELHDVRWPMSLPHLRSAYSPT